MARAPKIRTTDSGVGGFLRRFSDSTDGGILVMAAVAVPALAILAIGATELQAVMTDKSIMQDAADEVVLTSARELVLARHEGVTDRAEGYAMEKLTQIAGRATVKAAATLEDGGTSVKLVITSNRISFFGNMLPPGGFNTAVQAKATTEGGLPLCLITLDGALGSVLEIRGESELSAPRCMVHANRDLVANDVSRLSAGYAGAVGRSSGNIIPIAVTGLSPVDDPFAERELPVVPCSRPVAQRITTNTTIYGGLHCGLITIDADVEVKLAPGIHYFQNGGLIAAKGSRLIGNDVALVFGASAQFNFMDQATVELTGRRSGVGAGVVLAATRDNRRDFNISSTNVRRLEGVIYMPSARLVVSGGKETLAASEWTVSITRDLRVTDGAKLVINNDYDASLVPVPSGVGPRASGVRLVH